ncbi:phospholipase D/Transphosphatidylase [Geobacter metallireducens RCH3]|uniref:Phospholipase D superfamily protein n=1 Tax=Geobacter metallireducens (strain ATCC 53774 / DSM 7210 / GS-15) TaxID=269799 RepID=Q39ZJ7_GEOMG|nr:phospholipase D family protein [Geobacter metallireducens]ABB30327.1 phospholipase D superfamily protein [Geobacter metallireducens GS-15]EHP84920.1 phospholipase D/Transphosphatidylase [Geobacter metallireducens RCH3]
MIRPLLLITLSLLLILTAVPGARLSAAETTPVTLPLARSIQPLLSAHPGKTGLYVLEKGEESLLARAWLADHATKSIDVQYFIWSSDNIGILASEALLRAAERGIRVRVLVDDLLIDAPPESLLALARHPNIDIRIYNPKMTVGTSKVKRFANVVTGFRSVNQRMHDKTALFDGMVGITGGRNMADEYYDFDQEYTFRDRDMLMLGPTVAEAEASFARFWESPLAVPVEKLLKKPMKKMTPERTGQVYAGLHAYAGKPENFAPEVRQALQNLPRRFDGLLREMVWDEARFISDLPGKNSGREGLGGGGRSTAALVDAVSRAKRRVTIQSPYLVMPEGGVELFRKLIRRGVEVRIVTNSLAATDNLQAFSGYRKQRNRLLKAGITIREFRPDPAVRQELIDRYPKLKEKPPTFALHAKTMVIDGVTLFVGTFNLDPRSANLNTEVGVMVRNPALARQVEERIERDMRPENSWNPATDNPDRRASAAKRNRLRLWKSLPLTPIL